MIDYVHLNPVRAGIVPVGHLGGFRWSSLRWFVRGPRPSCLEASALLDERHLEDSSEGWRGCVNYLQEVARDEDRQRELGYDELSQGWAIGTRGWKRALAKDFGQRALDRGLDAAEIVDFRESRWQELLEAELKRTGPTLCEASKSLKGVGWKVEIARHLRAHGVPYKWVAKALWMGSAGSVRGYVNRAGN